MSSLDHELEALELARLETAAPERAAEARDARERAARALEAGDATAFAEEATLARAALELGLEEDLARSEAQEIAQLEVELSQVDAQVAALDQVIEAEETRNRREVHERAVREEIARALARAEVEEARPRRATHVSLNDESAREAGEVLEARIQIFIAALRLLGHADVATSINAQLNPPPRESPMQRLARLDTAYIDARAALARSLPNPSAEEPRIEALRADGFEIVQVEEGLRIRLGAGIVPRRRVQLLGAHLLGSEARLLAVGPAAPPSVALRQTLIDAGLNSSLVSVSVIASATEWSVTWLRGAP